MTPLRTSFVRALPFLRIATVVALVAGGIVAVGAPAQAAVAKGSPVGALNVIALAPGGVHVQGFALDPDKMAAPVRVVVYSDGALLAYGPASMPRPDVAKRYPTAGPNHGFDQTVQRPPGAHRICVYAVNIAHTVGANVTLGCKALTFGVNPRGRVESIAQVPGGIKVSGWALDPDSTSSIPVEVYADGVRVTRATASQARPSVGHTYPEYGSAHGFVATATLAQGPHNICVYAINVAAGDPKTALLCRTVTLNFEPRGTIETLRQSPVGFTISGWAFDPDTSAPIRVHVYLDGKAAQSIVAGNARPDIARAYPAAGPNHGYATSVGAHEGTHKVCVYGMNVLGGQANPMMACRNITISYAPAGAFESATRTSAARITVVGWAADPDTAKPIEVQVGLDGKKVATISASVSRPDIAKARGIAVQHGYRIAIAASSGEHRVCVRAVNVLAGTDKLLGCRIVIAVHPVAPNAPQVTARAGYASATVSWTPSRYDGGAPIRHFTIRSSTGGKWKVVSSLGRSVVITGLAAGGRYYFTVTATNVAGTSHAGRSNTIVTPRAPAPQTTPAPVSTSHYIRNIDGTSTDIAKMRAMGAADAAHNPSGHSYIVLLDIGGQGTFGGTSGVVLSATSRFVSNAGLVAAINAYVDGYATKRRPNAPVVIAVGANNDMTVTTSTGLIWARNVVNPIAAHTARYSAMSVAGANDIEPGFGANAAQSKAWLNGYLHGTTRPFVFNGSADGCSWSQINGRCNNGWTAGDLHWLSGGASPSRIIGLPQIYNQTMAQQWKYISLTGVAGKRHKINFGGPLTEYTACVQARTCSSLTGGNAWRALWSAVRSDARISQGSLPYATDLRIN